MSASHKSYRVYGYDAANRALNFDDFAAASDEDAITIIQDRGFGTKCEIWEGKRLVAALETERQTG